MDLVHGLIQLPRPTADIFSEIFMVGDEARLSGQVARLGHKNWALAPLHDR